MKLSIRDFPKAHPSESLTIPFSGAVDLSGLRFFKALPFPEPVRIAGTLRSRHGEVAVEYTAAYALHEVCARCLAGMVRPMERSFSHRVAEHAGEEDDDTVEAPGGVLDLDALLAGDLLFTLDLAPLCREDCKGLCPLCGQNRNEADCGCAPEPFDPRFQALKTLLE